MQKDRQRMYDRRKRADTFAKFLVVKMLDPGPNRVPFIRLQKEYEYFIKKGLVCVFPHIFNGKKVKKFNKVGRPIGENDLDLIEDYYYNISKNTYRKLNS